MTTFTDFFTLRLFIRKARSARITATIFATALAASAITVQTAAAQSRFDNVTIKPTKISDSVYMLTGAGGNIGVSAGEDGILIVDDQFAPLGDKIAAALKAIQPKDLRFIINTHFHGDHTGGNAKMREHHHHATIVAHDNVRVRLVNNAKLSKKDWPVVTYEQGVKFHFNDDVIHVRHVPTAHTDGDSFVYFEKANVLHTGDLMFNKMFPYIDLKSGGTVNGYIAAAKTMLNTINADTKIIPGHGGQGTYEDMQRYIAMLEATAAKVKQLKADGKSVEAITEQGLDDKWQSWSWNFISEFRWIKTLYDGQQ